RRSQTRMPQGTRPVERNRPGAPHAILIRRPMKISSVRSYLLSYPFAEPIRLPFYGGERTILKRDAMFIRVEADNGLVGYAPGPASEQARHVVEHTIGPFLVDRTVADPDALRVQFLEGPGAHPEIAKLYCCAEIALYDLL